MHAKCRTCAASGILHTLAAGGTTTCFSTALLVQYLFAETGYQSCGVMQCTHVGSCSAHTTVVISSHAYCKHGACHIGKVNIHCFLLKQSVTAIVNAVAFPCVAAALQ